MSLAAGDLDGNCLEKGMTGGPSRQGKDVGSLVSRTYYWPKMEDDVEAYVIACFVNKTRLNVRRRRVCCSLCQSLRSRGCRSQWTFSLGCLR